MDPEDLDAPEVPETPEADEPTEEAPEAEQPQETADEKIARLEKEKADLDKRNRQLFERAKKAEQAKPADGVSADDIIALTGIDAEDRERVRKWATQTGTSITEALNDPDLKLILDTRAEERRTAAATSIGSGRGSSKVTGEQLLDKARTTGEVPDTDEGMAKLAEARQASLTKKKTHRT